MDQVTVHGAEAPTLTEETDLAAYIRDALTSENLTMQDGDILVLTSKIVSIATGRMIDLDTVTVSQEAARIADHTGMNPHEVELILQDADDVLGVIPLADIAEDYIMEHAADQEHAEAALDNLPAVLVTERNDRLCTNAGVDLSNTPPGKATLLPQDPDAEAAAIRQALSENVDGNLAVVIADTELSLHGGTVDIAIGAAGIQPVDDAFGTPDLFDQPKIGGLDVVVDEVTAAAALVFKQAAESTPIAVLRGVDYKTGEGGTPDTSTLFTRSVATALRESVYLRLLTSLP